MRAIASATLLYCLGSLTTLASAGRTSPLVEPVTVTLPLLEEAIVRPHPGKPMFAALPRDELDFTRVTLLYDGFEGAFPGPWTLAGNPTWRDLTDRPQYGSWAAYCVGGRSNKVAPPGPYPPNCASYMTAGPFDLSDAVRAYLTFYVWRDLGSGDQFQWVSSGDGTAFSGLQSGASADWTFTPAQLDFSSLIGDDSVWIRFGFLSDDSLGGEGVWLDQVSFFKQRPTLVWAGTAGYTDDGVDPDIGVALSEPAPTNFVFKAKYYDPTNDPPAKARCIISKRVCRQWQLQHNLAMTLESGNPASGAVYSATTQLPNEVFKYRFLFEASNGAPASGDPTEYQQGPDINGRAKLCWYGKGGFVGDGVDPNSGPVKSSFKYMVLYQDSAGTQPLSDKRNVIVRRNGAFYKLKAMNTYSGDWRLGKPYVTSLWLNHSGTYTYRFQFDDGVGPATGEPATWQSGPTVTDSSSGGALTGLAALPTGAGAQVNFVLSSDADVTATVLNVAGRPIRTLAAGKPLEAGTQTLPWNRRSDGGLAVPAGLYLIRVTARSPDGPESSAVATLAVR